MALRRLQTGLYVGKVIFDISVGFLLAGNIKSKGEIRNSSGIDFENIGDLLGI
jgi:hypothetical protein